MSGPAIWPSSPWVEAIGWMLLHSLWQGAGVAMALAVVLGILRRAPSTARYLAACAAMILIVALPAATLLRSGGIPTWPRPRHDAISGPAISTAVTPVASGSLTAPRPVSLGPADRLRPMLPAIVGLWLAGVGLFSLRLAGGWIQARRWARRHTRPLADPWPDRLDRLKERLGIRRAVMLLESARVEVPMVVGWLRPAILVPAAALSGLSVAELEAILAHELAHIRRHDYLVNLVQCVVEVLVFYHPATWWISRVIRREREQCCDDLAVAACRDRVTYARALAAMEGLRVPAFSPSTAASGGILLARVRRVLNPQEESMNPVRILAGLAVVLAAAPLWLAHADDDPPAPATPAQAFPNRSFADIIPQIEQAPTGRALIRLDSQPDRPPAPQQPQAALETVDEIPVMAGPDTPDICLDPPSEAEVWARMPKPSKDRPKPYDVRRKLVRTAVEKIGAKTDPVKVYPLAGACQLVHCYYKCTVYYDEISDSDYPIPFHHVDHKVEVIYINKDHLRRATRPGQAPQDSANERLAPRQQAHGRSIKLPEGPISEIGFEGNATIPPEKLRPKLLSKAGQPFDGQEIDADVKTLMQTNWFSEVRAFSEESPPKSGKHALIFAVREVPVLNHVEFRGRKAIPLKELEDATGLKKGNRADPYRTGHAVGSILRIYKDRGYEFAEVELLEGGNVGDAKVVIQIFEGPKVKIGSIEFVGCRNATPAILQAHIASREPILGYHRDLLDEDRQKLMDYYQGRGFFEAKVTPVTRPGRNVGEVDVTFLIQEGPRYSVRDVIIQGNSKLKTEKLMDGLELHAGKPYLTTARDADKDRILGKYHEIGCIDTQVAVEPRFTDQPGVIDLVYNIVEGEPFLLGQLVVRGTVVQRSSASTAPMATRLERLSREIEQLKRARRGDRGAQDRTLDRLIEELEGLNRELRDNPKAGEGEPSSRIR